VVTSFEFRLHPVGPTVLGGLLAYPFAEAEQLVRHFRDVSFGLPRELALSLQIVRVPRRALDTLGLRGLEAGAPVVIVVVCWHGDDLDEGRAALTKLGFGRPVADTVALIPYVEMQRLFDAVATPTRAAMRSGYLDELSGRAIELVLDHTARPSPLRHLVDITPVGANVVERGAGTAVGTRAPGWLLQMHAMWSDEGDDDVGVRWVECFFQDMRPLIASDRAYSNHLGADEGERFRRSHGADVHERLLAVKRRYDPENMFRRNQNIDPG
jgi:FAD/FMN-containing dehydrogenase